MPPDDQVIPPQSERAVALPESVQEALKQEEGAAAVLGELHESQKLAKLEHEESEAIHQQRQEREERRQKRKRPDGKALTEATQLELDTLAKQGGALTDKRIPVLRWEGDDGQAPALTIRKPITFRGCVIDVLAWHHVVLKAPVRFVGCVFARGAYFGVKRQYMATLYGFTPTKPGARFEAECRFDRCFFEGRADFLSTVFAGPASFADCEFTGKALFNQARFEQGVSFDHAVNNAKQFRFNETEFLGEARFANVAFQTNAYFTHAVFRGEASFLRCDAATANMYFEDSLFEGDARFEQFAFREAYFQRARFARAASFLGSSFAGEMNFARARFEGSNDWSLVAIHDLPVLDGAEFTPPGKLVLSDEEKRFWFKEIRIPSINDLVVMVVAVLCVHLCVYFAGMGKSINLFLFYALAGTSDIRRLVMLQKLPVLGGKIRGITNKMSDFLTDFRPRGDFTEVNVVAEILRVLVRIPLFPTKYFKVWINGLYVNVVLVALFLLYNVFVEPEFDITRFRGFFYLYVPLYTLLTPLFCFFRFYNNREARYRVIFRSYAARKWGENWRENDEARATYSKYRGRWPRVYLIDYLHWYMLGGIVAAAVITRLMAKSDMSWEQLFLGVMGRFQ